MRFVLLICMLFLPISMPSLLAQKAKPFVYTGYSKSYANLGGNVGIGVGVDLDNRIAVSLALGKISTSSKNLNLDVGVKAYIFDHLFLGLNYGLIDYEKRSDTIERKYGMSLSLGGQLLLADHLFISPFVGISMGARLTDDFGLSPITQFGILAGYRF